MISKKIPLYRNPQAKKYSHKHVPLIENFNRNKEVQTLEVHKNHRMEWMEAF